MGSGVMDARVLSILIFLSSHARPAHHFLRSSTQGRPALWPLFVLLGLQWLRVGAADERLCHPPRDLPAHRSAHHGTCGRWAWGERFRFLCTGRCFTETHIYKNFYATGTDAATHATAVAAAHHAAHTGPDAGALGQPDTATHAATVATTDNGADAVANAAAYNGAVTAAYADAVAATDAAADIATVAATHAGPEPAALAGTLGEPDPGTFREPDPGADTAAVAAAHADAHADAVAATVAGPDTAAFAAAFAATLAGTDAGAFGQPDQPSDEQPHFGTHPAAVADAHAATHADAVAAAFAATLADADPGPDDSTDYGPHAVALGPPDAGPIAGTERAADGGNEIEYRDGLWVDRNRLDPEPNKVDCSPPLCTYHYSHHPQAPTPRPPPSLCAQGAGCSSSNCTAGVRIYGSDRGPSFCEFFCLDYYLQNFTSQPIHFFNWQPETVRTWYGFVARGCFVWWPGLGTLFSLLILAH